MTTDDIVTRLRECWCSTDYTSRNLVDPACDHNGVREEAADEIERLRKEEEETFLHYRKTIKECDVLEAEIERLRAELVNVRDLLDHTYQELRKYYDADEAVHDGFGVTVNVVPGKNWNPEQIAEKVKEALKDER